MKKLLLSAAACGVLLFSASAFAAPILSGQAGMSAGDVSVIEQVKMSKKQMIMMKKKKMMRKKMM